MRTSLVGLSLVLATVTMGARDWGCFGPSTRLVPPDEPTDAGPAPCPDLNCAPVCPAGTVKDANGCDTCQCAPACTADADCPRGARCVLRACPDCGPQSDCTGSPCTGVCEPVPTECLADSDCPPDQYCEVPDGCVGCAQGDDCQPVCPGRCALRPECYGATTGRGGQGCVGPDDRSLPPECCRDSCRGAWLDPRSGLCRGPADGVLPAACCGIAPGRCDDGNPLTCRRMAPAGCEGGLVVAIIDGCYQCVNPTTCEPPAKPCGADGTVCAPGETCVNGVCQGVECPVFSCNLRCPGGFAADANGCPMCRCLPPQPACSADRDCATGQRCVNGACQGGECPPVCTMHCPFGMETDAAGCPVCRCKPSPRCGDDAACPPAYACMDGQCVSVECDPVTCDLYCANGYAVDPATGCPACRCNPVECSADSDCAPGWICDVATGRCAGPVCNDAACLMDCPWGYVVDPATGCEICQCKPPPACASNADCATGEICGADGLCHPQACLPVVCTLYCEFGFATDPATGCEVCRCNPRPCSCSAEYLPVCGADGQTYQNACVAGCANVAVASPGVCGGCQIACFRYDPVCGEDGVTYACGEVDARCHGTRVAYAGECRPTCEINCLVYEPVCGADGVTYACGEADARCHGTTVAHAGECGCVCTEQYAPVCGANGQTYGNACEAACSAVQVRHAGVCGAACSATAACAWGQRCLADASGVGECVPVDFCYAPADCSGLPVPPVDCVGHWSCVRNACRFECG